MFVNSPFYRMNTDIYSVFMVEQLILMCGELFICIVIYIR